MILTEKNVAEKTNLCYTAIEVIFVTTGERIRQARKERNWTQKKLGEESGIAEPTIRRYELGKLNPKFETLRRIANALQVPVAALMDQTSAKAYQSGFDTATDLHDYYDNLVNELWKEYGYTGSEVEANLVSAFSKLNPEGQQKAVERVEELTEIPEYKK